MRTPSAGIFIPQNIVGVSARQFLIFMIIIFFVDIVYSSQSYMHKYLTDIEHDNTYVTRYYRKIDARRKKIGKHTLLPLKKTEKSKSIDLRSYKLVNRECDHLVGIYTISLFTCVPFYIVFGAAR